MAGIVQDLQVSTLAYFTRYILASKILKKANTLCMWVYASTSEYEQFVWAYAEISSVYYISVCSSSQNMYQNESVCVPYVNISYIVPHLCIRKFIQTCLLCTFLFKFGSLALYGVLKTACSKLIQIDTDDTYIWFKRVYLSLSPLEMLSCWPLGQESTWAGKRV